MRKLTKHWSFKLCVAWVIIAVFANYLANNKALIVKDKNGFSFPVLSSTVVDSSSISFQLNTFIPYSYNTIDYKATGATAPIQLNKTQLLQTHWLGTDFIGRDVLANLIHGSRSALIIGFFSMLLASFIGILLGGIAAANTIHQLHINILSLISVLLILLLYCIQIYLIPWEVSSVSSYAKIGNCFILTLVCFLFIFLVLKFLNKQNKRISISLDRYINGSIEVLESLPLIFLLVTLNAIIIPSYFSIILIIALVAWPTFARFTRAEFLKIIRHNYIESARASGYTTGRILLKHILPNALTPLFVTFAFGMISAILVESTLTFMGLGLANEAASWGDMINGARRDYSAWWLAIFPGITLVGVLFLLNKMSAQVKKLI